jgi:ATP-dependent DNA helicase RecG
MRSAKLLSMMPLRSHLRPVTRLSPRAFWRRFGRLEHEQLDFKRSARYVQESVAAMAMADGGVILIGVSDDRRILGCESVQDALDRLASVSCETDVDVRARVLRVGRADVVMVAVPAVRGRIVTTADGRLLRRVGSANQPLRGDAVARFIRARDATAAAAA